MDLTEEEAYLRMRNESRRLRRPMKDLAEAIILSEELSRKDRVGCSASRDMNGQRPGKEPCAPVRALCTFGSRNPRPYGTGL